MSISCVAAMYCSAPPSAEQRREEVVDGEVDAGGAGGRGEAVDRVADRVRDGHLVGAHHVGGEPLDVEPDGVGHVGEVADLAAQGVAGDRDVGARVGERDVRGAGRLGAHIGHQVVAVEPGLRDREHRRAAAGDVAGVQDARVVA